MKRRDFLGALTAAAAIPVLGPARLHARLQATERLVERWSWIMGQSVHLTLYAGSDDEGYDAAAAAFAELRRIEDRLSAFDDGSDLAEFNRRAGRPPGRVGSDLAAVLRAGAHFRSITGGAFDMAVEPLMRAWGFRSPRATAPSPTEVGEAREVIRHTRLTVDGSLAGLSTAEARVDSGGLAVGYGLDRAVAVLRRRGIRRALLDISGDIYALGAPPGARAWAVAVVDSAHPAGPVQVVPLRDAALATSANTVSAVRYGSIVAGHVMDPHAGWPAAALVQATVVAPTGLEADALSTAMLVSGRLPYESNTSRTFRISPSMVKGLLRNCVACSATPALSSVSFM